MARMKFSLRTFLLVIAVVCFWLGWSVPPAVRNKQAVDTIVHTHGASFRPGFDGPLWMQRLLPSSYTMSIESAGFDSPEFNDAALREVVDSAEQLRTPIDEYVFKGTSVTQDGLSYLKSRFGKCRIRVVN